MEKCTETFLIISAAIYQDDEDETRVTMIPNTAKDTLNWFQRKKVKLLERPDNHLT